MRLSCKLLEVKVKLRFPSVLTFAFDLIFGPKWALFEVVVEFKNCFEVYSCSWTTFTFYDSFNSDVWIWPNYQFALIIPDFHVMTFHKYPRVKIWLTAISNPFCTKIASSLHPLLRLCQGSFPTLSVLVSSSPTHLFLLQVDANSQIPNLYVLN